MESVINVFYAALRMSTPIIFAAMGGILAHQAGLMNIGIEGTMLMSAFAAVVVASLASSLLVGVLAAVMVGVAVSVMFAFFCTRLKTNLVVTGLAVNVMALGVTSYLLELMFNKRGAFAPTNITGLPKLSLGPIKDIPVIGQILSGHNILVYLAFVSVLVTAWVLYHTVLGLRIRATGEDVETARAAGIPVRKVQYIALALSGALAGLAGVQLSLGDLVRFNENMTNGRGFMALAAYYFGRTRPGMTLVACLIFGFFEALQFRLQGGGMPPQAVQAMPYLAVIIALAVVAVRNQLAEVRRRMNQDA